MSFPVCQHLVGIFPSFLFYPNSRHTFASLHINEANAASVPSSPHFLPFCAFHASIVRTDNRCDEVLLPAMSHHRPAVVVAGQRGVAFDGHHLCLGGPLHNAHTVNVSAGVEPIGQYHLSLASRMGPKTPSFAFNAIY